MDIGKIPFVHIALRNKALIALFTICSALASSMGAHFLPNVYKATAVIMPPQPDQSSAGLLLGQIVGGGIIGGSGVASALGLKNPNDLYVGVLKSRPIADNILTGYNLKERYEIDTWVEAREELATKTKISAGKDGLIRIEFEDEDAKLAAAVANAYVKELEALTAELAISEASRRRLYFEKQVGAAQESLAAADMALKKVQESTGLIKPDEQAKAIFDMVATVRARIAAKETELVAMRTFATASNPAYVRTLEELAGMKKQLAGLERDNSLGSGDILIPTGKVPEVGLEFLKRYREVKYNEMLYELLSKQLEIARIDEGRNATLIQTVEAAVAPDKETRPNRAAIIFFATVAGLLIGMTAAIARDHIRNDQSPSSSHFV